MVATDSPTAANEDLMKVRATTPPQAIAQSIIKVLFDLHQTPVIRAIGAGAVGQTCKGIAIARGQVATRGRDLGVAIGFETIAGDSGKNISALTFHLFYR